MIVSNPPYIRRGDLPGLQPEIARYEPGSALDGGVSGVEDLRDIIDGAPEFLKPGGYLLLEIGNEQPAELARIVEKNGCYQAPVFHKDYSGHDRVLVLRKR